MATASWPQEAPFPSSTVSAASRPSRSLPAPLDPVPAAQGRFPRPNAGVGVPSLEDRLSQVGLDLLLYVGWDLLPAPTAVDAHRAVGRRRRVLQHGAMTSRAAIQSYHLVCLPLLVAEKTGRRAVKSAIDRHRLSCGSPSLVLVLPWSILTVPAENKPGAPES